MLLTQEVASLSKFTFQYHRVFYAWTLTQKATEYEKLTTKQETLLVLNENFLALLRVPFTMKATAKFLLFTVSAQKVKVKQCLSFA